MTAHELAERLSLEIICEGAPDAEIACGYTGDLLSFVLAHARTGCAWFTIMTNVNVAAVALLVRAGCVVLCEGEKPDAELLERARNEGMNIYSSRASAFELAKSAVI